MDQTPDLMLQRPPAPQRRGAPGDAASHRFSPLNAPQRAVVDAFCRQARPWALRQAARSYGHLPEDLREQATDQAMLELRNGAPAAVDRRTLYGELADALTNALGRVHVGWCLNQSAAALQDPASAAATAPASTGQRVAGFIEDALGGLERAVLQLEMGAGRDTRTTRAALRLGPRQYARHRERGLSKLRDAIAGHVAGSVCEQHLAPVVLAATGDRAAADALGAGPGRCRACSREAQGLRRVLHERLALAPWPLVIKPAGLLTAKLGAVGAALGAKGGAVVGAGGSLGSLGTGAGALTAVLAAAVVATSGALGAGASAPAERTVGEPGLRAPVTRAADRPGTPKATPSTAASPRRQAKRSTSAEAASRTRAAARRPGASRAAPASPPAVTPPAAASLPASAPPAAEHRPRSVVEPVVGSVGDVTDKVEAPLAPSLPQTVEDTLGQVHGAVDQVTGTVDQSAAGLLTP